STGRRGFISPSVVTFAGSSEDLQRIIPPATPTPTFTPTPPTNGDLIMNGSSLKPDKPRCAEQFEVQLNVANIGSTTTNSTFTVRIQDIDIQSGSITASGVFVVSVLMAPGQNFVAPVPITVSAFPGRDHRITATVDADNQILEENEGNNGYTFDYRLRQGNC
ncbi:MAG TPA: CARDB domain-containing protein, partial [Phototrophicaceae bacterium]|nr:CARDB domain-containing protein [Phototrophicaceae bacterium]